MNALELQLAWDGAGLPTAAEFQRWVDAALIQRDLGYEVVIRVVGEEESAQLNEAYRHRNGPTNVLSFPSSAPIELVPELLGDLVICAPVVAREALEQGKPLQAHWAHMVIHGVLHLQGYDHLQDDEAIEMESREINILKTLGFDDPYQAGRRS